MRRPSPPVPSHRAAVAPALLAVVALVLGACSYAPVEVDTSRPALAQSTMVYAADGTLITTLRAEEHRESVRLGQLPRHVVDAVVAIEDARFWEHRGVDVRAVLRAAVANVREGAVVQGGSTITQQYVKTTLLGTERTLDRKVEEALVALEVERHATKERILELYLNTIYFGNGAYGVQAAAEEYFGRAAGDLDVAQAATLAGLIRAPSAYDPTDAPDAALARRDDVLARMVDLGWLAPEVAATARRAPLGVTTRDPADRYPAAHFVEQVKQFVLDDPRFGETRGDRQELLFRGGLRITTTLDLGLQAAAEEAVARVLPDPAAAPDAAVISIEPGTGGVRALVGGRDFFGGGARAKLDLATGGPGRPAGSAFKPLVLAAALEEGIPLDRVYPSPAHLRIPLPEGPWDVDDYEGTGGGRSTLRQATIRSSNTVYAQLVQDVGPADAAAMAARLGVASPLPAYPSIALGTADVHPIDMAAAYATLANRGLRVPPAFVTTVALGDGTVLYQHQHHQDRVLDARLADEVTGVLRAVVEQGTGVRARIGRPVAGKTGTGQEWRDAWFVGYTPELATAVWTGFAEEGRRSMVPPATPFRVTGGTWPAEIWQLYTSAALATVPVTPFVEPSAEPPAPAGTGEGAGVGQDGDGQDGGDDPRLPDVVGRRVAPAEATLADAGWAVARRNVPDDDYPAGFVVGQHPRAGAPAAPGSTVTLDVADGRRASAVVPDVLGLDEAEAVARLAGPGLAAEAVVEAEPSAPGGASGPGHVWKQRPAAGTLVAPGSAVTLWINPAGGGAAPRT